MKRIKRFPSLVSALVSLAALTAAPWSGRAQANIGNFGTLTNLPAVVTAAATSNQTSWVSIPRAGNLALQWTFNTSTNVGTQVCGLLLVPSVDGTNLSTTVSWPITAAANGWTNVVATTNLARTLLEGYSYVVVAYLTNATAGTLTNKGVVLDRIYNTTSW